MMKPPLAGYRQQPTAGARPCTGAAERSGRKFAQARIVRSLLAVYAHNTLCKPCTGEARVTLIMPTRAIRWFPDPTKDR